MAATGGGTLLLVSAASDSEISRLFNRLESNEVISLKSIIRNYKSITLDSYSDLEICPDPTCFSCK